MLEVRYVRNDDMDNWFKLDGHLREEEFYNKVRDKTGYVLLCEGGFAGILRYNLFWDSIPFCNLIYLDGRYRGMGYGRTLMEHWENDMKSKGFDLLLLSTRSDEDAQHFYRKLGYKDCGCIMIDIGKYAQPGELFFIKPI